MRTNEISLCMIVQAVGKYGRILKPDIKLEIKVVSF